NDTGWSQVSTPVAPSARTDPAMVYDSATHQLVMTGGYDVWGEYHYDNDVWTFSPQGLTWAQIPVTNGFSISNPFLIYDTGHDRVYMFGGRTSTSTNLSEDYYNELLSLNASGPSWSGPPWEDVPAARFAASMVYDSLRERAILFGGYPADDLWQLSLTDPSP